MTKEQFKSLRRGDVIRGLGSGTAFIVDAHYGDFVIAMKSMHVSNPSEWELCAKTGGAVDKQPTTGKGTPCQPAEFHQACRIAGVEVCPKCGVTV